MKLESSSTASVMKRWTRKKKKPAKGDDKANSLAWPGNTVGNTVSPEIS